MTALSETDISRILDVFVPGGSGPAGVAAFRKLVEVVTQRADSTSPPALPIPGAPGAPVPPGGGPQARPEPTLDEIFAQLENLSLPAPILQRAAPIFAKANYELSHPRAKAQFDPRTLTPFTQARRQDGIKLALINVPREVYRKNKVWGSLAAAVEEIDGFVRFLSEDYSDTNPGFAAFLKQAEQRGKKWAFTPWNWVDEFLREKETIERVFQLPEPGAASPSPLNLGDLTENDRKTIKLLLINRAVEGGNVKPGQVLRNLGDAAGWPAEMLNKIAGYGDDPDDLAYKVRDLAIEWSSFESTHGRYGDTYLGALMQALLAEVGSQKRTQIAELIMRYNLVSRPDSLAGIKKLAAA